MRSAPADALSTRIADRADAVRSRIAAACARAGRSPDAVTLVAVTKTFPLPVVEAAVAAGLRDFGENRVQELAAKAEALPGEHAGGGVRWHLIGHLQRNKAKEALRHADAFHALDSLRLAETLERRAAQAGRVLPCLVQVNVSGEGTKEGVDPEEAHALLGVVASFAHLRIDGLMTMAAPAATEAELETVVRPQFRQLRRLAETAPGGALPVVSMGMSGDYEVAVEEGATHVRLGSALFGPRS
ncbi:MAG: YggS family pyridoxal phosphate-dependent enzyme [Rubricoccaceae bacterium]|nr:YggS family pyridoxal phosphate-dependent enzyme [Rubricoccaceae bacterium]